jgi:hypothetical protein
LQVNLSIFGKKGKGPGDGAPSDFFSQKQQQQQQQRSLVGRLASSLNPLTWFGSGKAHQFDTGERGLAAQGGCQPLNSEKCGGCRCHTKHDR